MFPRLLTRSRSRAVGAPLTNPPGVFSTRPLRLARTSGRNRGRGRRRRRV